MENRKNQLIALTPNARSVIESKKIEYGIPSITAVVNKILEEQETINFLMFEKCTGKIIEVEGICNGVVFFKENSKIRLMSAEAFCDLDLYEDMRFSIPFNKKFFESKIESV